MKTFVSISAPESAPERVRCEPLSAQSLRVWWEPPEMTARGGVLLGYELFYEVYLNRCICSCLNTLFTYIIHTLFKFCHAFKNKTG